MITMEQVRQFGEAAISIFAIVNPIGGLPIFVGLTEDASPQERRRVFRLAGLAALAIICVMALVGQLLLDSVFQLRIEEFTFGGGLVLVAMGIQSILAGSSSRHVRSIDPKDRSLDSIRLAISPIASPLLVGPGSIVTVMLLVNQHGRGFALAACLAAFVFVILILNYAHVLFRVMGQLGSIAVGRVMQIFIVALGVKFCFRAVEQLIHR